MFKNTTQPDKPHTHFSITAGQKWAKRISSAKYQPEGQLWFLHKALLYYIMQNVIKIFSWYEFSQGWRITELSGRWDIFKLRFILRGATSEYIQREKTTLILMNHLATCQDGFLLPWGLSSKHSGCDVLGDWDWDWVSNAICLFFFPSSQACSTIYAACSRGKSTVFSPNTPRQGTSIRGGNKQLRCSFQWGLTTHKIMFALQFMRGNTWWCELQITCTLKKCKRKI